MCNPLAIGFSLCPQQCASYVSMSLSNIIYRSLRQSFANCFHFATELNLNDAHSHRAHEICSQLIGSSCFKMVRITQRDNNNDGWKTESKKQPNGATNWAHKLCKWQLFI